MSHRAATRRLQDSVHRLQDFTPRLQDSPRRLQDSVRRLGDSMRRLQDFMRRLHHPRSLHSAGDREHRLHPLAHHSEGRQSRLKKRQGFHGANYVFLVFLVTKKKTYFAKWEYLSYRIIYYI